MEAAEQKIQKVLDANKQFLVPHYQRPYSWGPEQWQTLWRDLVELAEDADAKPHFIGSIVSSPARTVPEGVEKRLLIDGQQRLTTLVVLLTLIRDRALQVNNARLADRVGDLITNRHDEGLDRFKLLPTHAEDPKKSDRDALVRMVSGIACATTSAIGDAYAWFDKKLRRSDAPDIDALFRTITLKLTLVSIILDEKDNPHRIFESLNGKGRPLSQADLIRNYFFMRLPEHAHERAYHDLWQPMQNRLGEDHLTPFVRHYLTRFVGVVRETDVYTALKSRVDDDNRGVIEHLRDLARDSEQYEILLHPEKAPTLALRQRLERLNRLEVTVAYPLLIGVLGGLAVGSRTEAEVLDLLDTIENFIVRRFVCGVPTHGLNKTLAPIYEQASRDVDFVSCVKRLLSANPRAYPRDLDFRDRLASARLYGAGERREKTKLLLERLEAALGHKEVVDLSGTTIEHVMPQTLTDSWKDQLGADWEEDYEQFLHTLGNLTLTRYNAELGNAPYAEKQARLATSHVEMNRYFAGASRWDGDAIERRAEALSELALATWPYFGPHADVDVAVVGGVADPVVTGTLPARLRLRGEDRPVQSWVDVATITMNAISAIGEEEFRRCVDELPKFVNWDATAFRRSSRLRKLDNGAYMETNLSASAIYRLCLQATELAGLGPADWTVERRSPQAAAEDNADDEPVATGTDVRQLQLDFWIEVRAALAITGIFPRLQTPRPQYWFDIAMGRSDIHLQLVANTQKSFVGIRVVIAPQRAERAMAGLLAARETIEQEIGAALVWNPHPEKQTKIIQLTEPCEVLKRGAWPHGIDWLASRTAAFYRAFSPRIRTLDLG